MGCPPSTSVRPLRPAVATAALLLLVLSRLSCRGDAFAPPPPSAAVAPTSSARTKPPKSRNAGVGVGIVDVVLVDPRRRRATRPPPKTTLSAVEEPSSGSGEDAYAGALAKDEDDRGDDGDDPTAKLRRDAERLRREAEALEEEMRGRRRERSSATVGAEGGGASPSAAGGGRGRRAAATYTDLAGSAWTVSYRFASDPPPRDDDNDGGGDKAGGKDVLPPPVYYSGRVDVLFRSDGYTTILSDEGVKDRIKFTKFWGWDEELSTLDNEKYLLFSADVSLPESDPYAVASNADSERIYFNARVEKNLRTMEVTLGDGKVTVKRDVEPPGGFWGFFSGRGILAQFRYAGDFVCRPIAVDSS